MSSKDKKKFGGMIENARDSYLDKLASRKGGRGNRQKRTTEKYFKHDWA